MHRVPDLPWPADLFGSGQSWAPPDMVPTVAARHDDDPDEWLRAARILADTWFGSTPRLVSA
ncbi:MAG: hypothetical protein AB7Q01_02255 [Gammaproteobacteria bacterium]